MNGRARSCDLRPHHYPSGGGTQNSDRRPCIKCCAFPGMRLASSDAGPGGALRSQDREPCDRRDREDKRAKRGNVRSTRQGCDRDGRSEEHTSELPSLMRIPYAAFYLKKKTNSH